MSRSTSRRRFMKTSAVIGAGYWALGGIAPRASRSANEKVQFASVGVGGKGTSDSQDAGRSGDVVAICDIDDKNLALAAARWPNAKKYNDFRKIQTLREKDAHNRDCPRRARCAAVAATRPRPASAACHCRRVGMAKMLSATGACFLEARRRGGAGLVRDLLDG